MKEPVFIGKDFGKDETVEVICRMLPDGTTEVISFHRYKRTIDLEAGPPVKLIQQLGEKT